MDEIARFKCQITLCSRLYLNHMSIAWIEGIEILPSWCAAVESVRVWSKLCETDSLGWCRRCMVMNAQLNNAWINEILQLPWKLKLCNSENLHDFFLNCFKQKSKYTCEWWILQKKVERVKSSWWMNEKKCVEKCENLRELVNFWIWSEIVIVDPELSVRIKPL